MTLSPETIIKGGGEKIEEKMDLAFFDYFIQEFTEYVDQGNNGIIFKVNLEKAIKSDKCDKLLKYLNLLDSDVDARAMKILKIYKSGEAEREAKLGITAHEINEKKKKNREDQFALTPQVIFAQDLIVSKEIRKSLLGNSEKVRSSRVPGDEKIGIILLEFFEGEDLAKHLYKEALKFAAEEDAFIFSHLMPGEFNELQASDPEKVVEELKQIIDEMDMGDLSSNVQRVFHYSKAKRRDRQSPEEFALAQEIVENKNAEILYGYLEKKGFIIDKDIVTQIRNTVNAWHEEDFYHKDLHPRNVMLVPSSDKKGSVQACLLDFGSAKQFGKNESKGDIYFDPTTNKRYVNDSSISSLLDRFSKTKADKKTAAIQEGIAKLRSLGVQLDGNPEWNKMLDKIFTDKKDFDFEEAYTQIIFFNKLKSDETEIVEMLCMLFQDVIDGVYEDEVNKISKSQVYKFIEEKIRDKATTQGIQTHLGKLQSLFK
jgi:serine/threonine protein kinase